MIRLAPRSGTYLPTSDEHELLRAALLDDRETVHASLNRWKSRVPFDAIELGSMRLLPLVYRNLQRHGIDDRDLPRFKGIYRNAWVQNQLVLSHGLHAQQALRAVGVDPVVLKGGALIADGSYAEPALRPMEDFDILVPRASFRHALDVLIQRGWRVHPQSAELDWYLPFRHAVAMRNDEGGELDLHWAAIRDGFGGDDDFCSAAVETKLLGHSTRVLCPNDQLLQICGHASARNVDVSPIRWAADVWFLIARHGATLDWMRVLSSARRRGLSFAVLRCLEYMRGGLGAAIPELVLRELEGDATLIARMSHRLRNSYSQAIYLDIASRWLRLALQRPFRRIPGRLRRLPRYARHYFHLDANASLLRFAARKLRKRWASSAS